MDYSTILLHPNHEEIVTKLITGVSPKDISQSLRLRYPDKDQKHLHISVKLLEDYAAAHVGNLMEHLQKDIVAVKSTTQSESKGDKPLATSLLNNKSYRDRLVQLVDQEVDIKNMIKELVLMIRERIEQVFDRIQENPSAVGKNDYALIKYFEVLLNAVDKFDRIHNNAPDQIIQHNVNIQMVDKTKAVFVEAVRKTLAHMDAESSILFVENISEALRTLEEPQSELIPTPESRMKEARMLSEMTIPSLPMDSK